jgi:hypothetical protein
LSAASHCAARVSPAILLPTDPNARGVVKKGTVFVFAKKVGKFPKVEKYSDV